MSNFQKVESILDFFVFCSIKVFMVCPFLIYFSVCDDKFFTFLKKKDLGDFSVVIL